MGAGSLLRLIKPQPPPPPYLRRSPAMSSPSSSSPTSSSSSSSSSLHSNNLRINLLLRSGRVDAALHLFDEMARRDAVSWNSMISGYVCHGSSERALALYQRMVTSGVKETTYTFSSILGACSGRHDGPQLHRRALALGFHSNLFVGSALVHFYMRAGSPDLALLLFRELPHRSTATCNAVLRGLSDLSLSDLGFTEELIHLFREMRWRSIEPDDLSFSYLLKGLCCCCCSSEKQLDQGKQLHCHIVKAGWAVTNIFVSNALVDFYSSAGDLIGARRSFDSMRTEDVISWNSMVSVCADNGHLMDALDYFHRMLWYGSRPSVRSLVRLLNSCSRIGNCHLGAQIHNTARKIGFFPSSVHVQSALIDMYGKCRDFDSALFLFNETPELNLECCNAMIVSALHCNVLDAAVEVFGVMVAEGVRPDNVTLSATIKAASSAASPSFLSCQILHSCAVKSGLEKDEAVSCSLMDAYARSGCITFSCLIFERLENPNVVCFTTLISAYGRNGMGREAVALLDTMISNGLKPDDVTFLCALNGCYRTGLVEEGRLVLESMRAVHGIEPDRRHYACMVNLLGRAGLLKEAMELMEEPSLRGHSKAWSSLLQNCRVHGDEEMGRIAAEALIGVESTDAAAHLQISCTWLLQSIGLTD
ncbi:Pentatricopeptide repeat-containing protein [Ananas comosus]|uniref:Pentatricopeptide repeat-containing protein n=1 Tax=Ananas comosus TaxID=4615 RepID=A0A199W092_ANACO|nr:Pentatricopeptide repeat-containing protein [Ananas comosus]